MNVPAIAIVVAVTLAIAAQTPSTPDDLSGRILFAGQAVPGATVTATQGDRTVATVSNDEGVFRFAGVNDGAWTVRVEMRGFVTETRDSPCRSRNPPLTIPLTMRRTKTSSDRGAPPPRPPAPAPGEPAAGDTPPDVADARRDQRQRHQRRLLRVRPAARVRKQPPAAGRALHRRRHGGHRQLRLERTAVLVRRVGARRRRPTGTCSSGSTLGGPLKIPWLVKNGPQSYVSYQHGLLHNANTQSAVMPNAAERAGDFSSVAGGGS